MIKTLFKIMFLILGIFILFFFIAYFWPDEALRPETEELLRQNLSPIPPEQNAYFTFYGMDAPLDQDAHAVGYEKAMALNRASAEFLKTGNFALIPDEKWGDAPISTEDDKSICKPSAEACFDKFVVDEQKIRLLIEKHSILLARYKSLYQRPRFHHMVMPSAFIYYMGLPNFLLLLRTHRLLLAEIGCDYLTKNKLDALKALQQDILYLRGILADANVLITRAIIISMLKSDLHLYAQMLDVQNAPPEAFAWNIPLLTKNERTLEHVIRYEFGIPANRYDMLAAHRQIAVNEFEDLSKWKKVLLRILPFKQNAMLNLSAPAYLKIIEMSHLSAFDAVRVEKEFSTKSAHRIKIRDYLTNPAGLMIYDDAFSDFTGAISRTHALDGLLRLVNLKQRIFAQRIPDHRIPAFLQEQAAEFGDPYTGQAMQWDTARRTVGLLSPFKPQTYIDELRLPELRQ